MIVFKVTKTNIEKIYYHMLMNGATVHPYGDSTNKKIGVARVLDKELIIKPGDYIVENEDGYEKIDGNVVHKLIQYGQLTIKE